MEQQVSERSDRNELKREWKLADGADREYLADLGSAVLQQSPRGGRLMLWAVVLFFVFAAYWASIAELDEVTRGTGKVIPSSQVQVIQNLEGGILAEILVSEGDIVKPGQTLLRIDDTRFASSYREGRVGYLNLKARAARLRAEAEGAEFVIPEEVQNQQPELVQREFHLFQSRAEELESNIRILEQQVNQRKQELAELNVKEANLVGSYQLLRRELDLTAPLEKEGVVSEVEVIRLKRQVNDLDGQLKATRLAIPRLRSILEEAEQKVEETKLEFRAKSREELNETLAELARTTEANQALEDRVKRTWVKSPVRGTVKQLMVNTVGGVIQPGMDLVEIVPLEDTLLVEAKIRPSDIAFIRPGQDVTVKLTAYDFAIYGGLHASLEHISADTITDSEGESFYLVRVRTDRNQLGSEAEPLPIIPGMQTEVDILTGKKTVLTYLVKPVLRGMNRALSER